MSGLDLTLDPERQPRRFEVINGAGGRRQWSVDEKARIIAETLEPNAIISEVARRYGLRPQQVFAWRREARKQAGSAQQDSQVFVPAVVTPTCSPGSSTDTRTAKSMTCCPGPTSRQPISGRWPENSGYRGSMMQSTPNSFQSCGSSVFCAETSRPSTTPSSCPGATDRPKARSIASRPSSAQCTVGQDLSCLGRECYPRSTQSEEEPV